MNTEQLKQLEKDLWSAADNLRANTGLKSTEYATPVLGLIFLKFADNRYRQFEKAIQEEFEKLAETRREKPISEIAVMAKSIKEAMETIEKFKVELDGVLPKSEYASFNRTNDSRSALSNLVKTFSDIPTTASGDILGKIYEFFLGKFALAEGQGGGEFFTPTSVVKLMVEIIEPHKGTVYDPACGSGGMFVQSHHFLEKHRLEGNELYVYGQEKTGDTVKLAKMNLAVNGLRGEIKWANSYSEDPYNGFGRFDFVMANPPFNVDDVPIATVESDARFNTYGIPRKKTKSKKSEQGKETVPNANYLWISLFATSLADKGRAALVMANSASDARHSEADIRKTLIENNLIYGMLTLPSNMFYTVTLPATLWFFDKDKQDNKILFIDARNIFTQIDRAHREFNEEQIQNIAVISKLHRGDREAFIQLVDGYFEKGMEGLIRNEKKVEPVTVQLLDVLNEEQGKQTVKELLEQWHGLKSHQKTYKVYQEQTFNDLSSHNTSQHTLREDFDPFFESLHIGLKQLDKVVREHEKKKAEAAKNAGKRTTTDRETKKLKEALELLHKEVKNAESFYKHIHWLQERFPDAVYEDVTGLCKLATQEEVAEQDYSLNPGRYVGVVIEEDGKTEEEFIEGLLNQNLELEELNKKATLLTKVIDRNIKAIVGDI